LLAAASCLLAPINWPEPFGLFMVEAEACGTPVVALNRGAAPEVVSHERTGFVVDDVDDMAKAIKMIGDISPAECRNFVRTNFDVHRMVDDYLHVYQSILPNRFEPAGTEAMGPPTQSAQAEGALPIRAA
jgi:glycosyltransferase involved in cell wall biosynthesis